MVSFGPFLDETKHVRTKMTREKHARGGQAVRKAGAAKREELLEYLGTPEGEALVARVAKLLVHAQRGEVRRSRARGVCTLL